MTTEQVKQYILAGNCVFTLYSKKLDTRYTFKIQQDKNNEERYFTKVLFGPDNENDYRIYIYSTQILYISEQVYTTYTHTHPQLQRQAFLKIVQYEYLYRYLNFIHQTSRLQKTYDTREYRELHDRTQKIYKCELK